MYKIDSAEVFLKAAKDQAAAQAGMTAFCALMTIGMAIWAYNGGGTSAGVVSAITSIFWVRSFGRSQGYRQKIARAEAKLLKEQEAIDLKTMRGIEWQ